jgi:hypothetical protein
MLSKQRDTAPLEASRRSEVARYVHEKSKIQRTDMNQYSLKNVVPALQMSSPYSIRFMKMRE